MARAITIIALVFALTACANTIRGVGRDIHSSANAVGDAIDGR